MSFRLIKKLGLKLSYLATCLLFIVILSPAANAATQPPAMSVTQCDINSIVSDTTFYDQCANNDCSIGSTININSAPPSQIQTDNAKTIIGIAKTEKLGKAGALIGLMVGLAESGLRNLANSNVPVSLDNPNQQGVGSDHDSVGIFQQRPSTGWSTIAGGAAADNNKDAVWQIMTPAYAAEAFFGSPQGASAPSAISKGLQNISGWQSLPPQVAAQKVQGSADSSGSNYARQQNQAQVLLDQNWDSAPAVKLPVAISGGSTNTNAGSSASGDLCSSGNIGGNGVYVNPFSDPAWQLNRTDQGVDYLPSKTLPVLAIGDGKIIDTSGSGWPGGVFIYYQLTSGPLAGKCIYFAEHLTNYLSAGTTIKAGQVIAQAQPGYPWIEIGWAQGPQTPSDPYNGRKDGTPTDGGKSFARFLRSLGAQTRDDPGGGPLYYGKTCPANQ